MRAVRAYAGLKGGGASGGTLASIMNIANQGPALMRQSLGAAGAAPVGMASAEATARADSAAAANLLPAFSREVRVCGGRQQASVLLPHCCRLLSPPFPRR